MFPLFLIFPLMNANITNVKKKNTSYVLKVLRVLLLPNPIYNMRNCTKGDKRVFIFSERTKTISTIISIAFTKRRGRVDPDHSVRFWVHMTLPILEHKNGKLDMQKTFPCFT